MIDVSWEVELRQTKSKTFDGEILGDQGHLDRAPIGLIIKATICMRG